MKSEERKQFLMDVFTIAMEGGIGHWAEASEYHWSKEGKDDVDGFFAVVEDAEHEDAFEKSTINKETIVKGINKIIKGKVEICDAIKKNITIASKENDGSYLDANDADCIVQVGLLGELVFG